MSRVPSRFVAIVVVAGGLSAPGFAMAQARSPLMSSPLTPLSRSLFQVPAEPAEPDPASPPPAAQPTPGLSGKVFNPDTSVIANFKGAAGRNPATEDPSMSLSEVEVSFQAAVDPYSRADFFLAASPEGVEVEEGYITFTALPAGLLLKVGKMRAQFGKVNVMHTHMLPWTDRPLVTEALLGGEEGLSDAGASLSKLIPNDVMYLEATGEVFRSASSVFQTDERSKLTYLGRLRGYRDLTEGTNLDLGVSFASGPAGIGVDATKRLVGFDATIRYRPLRRAIYRRFIGRIEFIHSHQDLTPESHERASGFYGSADYQFARRWYLGARVDRTGRLEDGSQHDRGASISLTFWPSEFSLIRGQFRRITYAEDVHANEVLFQLNFSIGAHGAHVF